jgi:ClpP class serine protease
MGNISELFWLFFILSFLQPVIRQKLLNLRRMKVLTALEKSRGTRVISLIHRQETMALLGFPVMRYIDIQDSEEILRAIELTDAEYPIDLIVHTPGGLVLAAGQIAHALHRHRGKVTVFVPHYAMSGGTLIALAANEIVMDPDAVLGPVDPQLGQFPAASVLTVLGKKEPKDIDDQTMIMADLARKAIDQVQALTKRLLLKRMPEPEAQALAVKLATGTWTHDYAITAEEAQSLGLPVTTTMPPEIHQFMSLFPQPTRTRPGVEYIPVPYRGRPGPSGH